MRQLLIKTTLAWACGLGLSFTWLILLGHHSAAPTLSAAVSRYVAPGGTDIANDFLDDLNPCATVQRAVDVANSEDIIKIATGVYTGVNTYGGLAQVVYVSKTVTLRGRYSPAFAGPPEPDANPVTLDAQGQGRVLYVIGDISPTLEGLTITGGDDDGLQGTPWGGDAGGGIYVITATAIVSRSTLSNNLAENGGGLSAYNSQITLQHNRITSNTATFGGGVALYNAAELDVDGDDLIWNGPATNQNNEVVSNTAGFGGGLFLFYSDASLDHNLISANQSTWGGGLYLGPGFQSLENNTITQNVAGDGGGLFLEELSQPVLVNNIIAANRANGHGSGFYSRGSSMRARHTSIAHNHGGDGTGLYLTDDGSGTSFSTVWLTNTIIVSHTVGITISPGNKAILESTLWHDNSLNWSGAGTITATHNYTGHPHFLDFAQADYHLGSTSAAIDNGVAAGITTDFDGDLRPQGPAPDLGADEVIVIEEPVEQHLFLPLILK